MRNREYDRLYAAAWRAAHREHVAAYQQAHRQVRRRAAQDWYAKLRRAIVAFLGRVCEDCGTDLTGPTQYECSFHVHHLLGDGVAHKQRVGYVQGVWQEVIAGLYPRDRVALLCPGCHRIRHGKRARVIRRPWQAVA